jgi:hypothetical protein
LTFTNKPNDDSARCIYLAAWNPRETPTHDEEGRKTHTQAAVRTLDKAVQDAESEERLFAKLCSSGFQTLTAKVGM